MARSKGAMASRECSWRGRDRATTGHWGGRSREDLRRRGLQDLGVKDLGTRDVVVEFSRDIVHALECAACGVEEEVFAPVGSIRFERGRCPRDGQMRVVKTIHGYDGSEKFGGRPLDTLGLPLFDVFTVRSGEKEQAYLMAGDKSAVLGEAV